MHDETVVSCPQARATVNRRAKLKKVYASKDWERACDEILNRGHIKIGGIIRGEGLQVGESGALVLDSQALLDVKVPCEWHKRITGELVKVGTLVHHTYLESYKDGTYVDLKTIDVDILCSRCHYAIHHELDLCICGKYMRRGARMCRACFDKKHPEIKAGREAKKAAAKALQKKLRDEEKERAKIWKLNNPPKVKRSS